MNKISIGTVCKAIMELRDAIIVLDEDARLNGVMDEALGEILCFVRENEESENQRNIMNEKLASFEKWLLQNPQGIEPCKQVFDRVLRNSHVDDIPF